MSRTLPTLNSRQVSEEQQSLPHDDSENIQEKIRRRSLRAIRRARLSRWASGGRLGTSGGTNPRRRRLRRGRVMNERARHDRARKKPLVA